MIYVLQLVSIFSAALFCFCSKASKRTQTVTFAYLAFFCCFTVMAFRDVSVGVDTLAYKEYYELIKTMSWKDVLEGNGGAIMEIGWNLANKLCSYVIPYYGFQIIFAFVYNLVCCKFILNSTEDVFPCTVIFIGLGLFAFAFNIQRQMLAALILACCYLALKNRRGKKAIALFLIAVCLHSSSLVALAGYAVYLLRNKKTFIRILPVAVIAVAANFQILIRLATMLFPRYINYFNNHKGTQTASGVWIIWIIILAISAFCIYSPQRDWEEVKETALFAIFSTIYVACNIIGLSFNYFERVGLCFMPFVPLLLINFANNFKTPKWRTVYFAGASACFSAYYLLSCFTGKAMEYSFFF